MTIETKYNIGDEVWVKYSGEPMSAKVIGRCVNQESLKIQGEQKIYQIEKYALLTEEGIFEGIYPTSMYPTKEELLKSL